MSLETVLKAGEVAGDALGFGRKAEEAIETEESLGTGVRTGGRTEDPFGTGESFGTEETLDGSGAFSNIPDEIVVGVQGPYVKNPVPGNRNVIGNADSIDMDENLNRIPDELADGGLGLNSA
ncbi:hypothetical protein BGX31_006155, partial [Mortierella sp. GBA43]